MSTSAVSGGDTARGAANAAEAGRAISGAASTTEAGRGGSAAASVAEAAGVIVTATATITAAELDAPPAAELLRGERLRNVPLESRLLLAAARLALRDAQLDTTAPDFDPDTLGVVVATRHAGLQEYVELYRAGTASERPRVNPARGPHTGLTAPAAELSIRLPAAGPNATIVGDRGVSEALQYANDQLAAGRAQAMLVCEVELAPPILNSGGESDPSQNRASVRVLEAEAEHPAPGPEGSR